jgi:hypothetical protein
MKRVYKLETNLTREENTKLLSGLDNEDEKILIGLDLDISVDLVDDENKITTIMVSNIINLEKIKSFLKKRDIEFDIEDVTKFFTEEEEEETLDSFLENITDEYIFDKLGIEQSN